MIPETGWVTDQLMGVNRFDSYGFTAKMFPHQPDKEIVSTLSTKIHLTDVGD